MTEASAGVAWRGRALWGAVAAIVLGFASHAGAACCLIYAAGDAMGPGGPDPTMDLVGLAMPVFLVSAGLLELGALAVAVVDGVLVLARNDGARRLLAPLVVGAAAAVGVAPSMVVLFYSL